MIFRVFKIYKNIKEGTKNPTGFARDEAFGLLKGAIVPFTVLGAIFVIFFFLLGFTPFWFGPSGFFKVVSVIMSFVWLGWFLLTRIILMFAKQLLRHTKEKIDSQIYHDVTPK